MQPSGDIWVIEHPFSVTLSAQGLATLTHTSVKTVERWLRQGKVPLAIADLLRHKAIGILAHPKWDRWRICEEGRLWALNGYAFYPGELENFQLFRSRNDQLTRDLKKN